MITWTICVMMMITVFINGDALTYSFHCDEIQYSLAAANCLADGDVLAQPKTEEQWLNVVNIFEPNCPSSDIWLGLAYSSDDSFFFWNDGNIMEWHTWKDGNPEGSADKSCIRARIDKSEWESEYCTATQGYVCQTDTTETVTETTTVITTDNHATTDEPYASTDSTANHVATTLPLDIDASATHASPISHDKLFSMAKADYIPDDGLLDETKARSTLACAIKCSKLTCALVVVGPNHVCKLFDQSAANATWITSPGAMVYFVQ